MIIGVLASGLSTFGFAIIQSRQQKLMKIIDTCGVTNLHGLPGLLGGLAALPVIKGLRMESQLWGILITILIAFLTGLAVGKILPMLGRKVEVYEDSEEFLDAE